MIKYSSQLENAVYDIWKTRNHHGKGTTYYCDDIFCFDIEVTSAWIKPNGEIVTYTGIIAETMEHQCKRITNVLRYSHITNN